MQQLSWSAASSGVSVVPPLTFLDGRWLRWDGARWVDDETGQPV